MLDSRGADTRRKILDAIRWSVYARRKVDDAARDGNTHGDYGEEETA